MTIPRGSLSPLLLLAAIVGLGLTLTACNRAPSGTTANDTSKPAPPPTNAVTFTPQTESRISSDDIPLLEQIDRENTKVVAAAAPSIVRVTAMSPIDPHAALFGDLPFKLPFGHGLPPGAHPNVPSYGSGVIISDDGYIVTNAHVVQDAQTVEVQLRDQRSFPARVVAADEQIDVAVLKISASGLVALPWGDSDQVEPGQQVFAIGNPFNLDDSVSKGIVSAKGRNLPDSNSYEDFIQTDAAINVGNSGGALINIHGELIGLNAAIASFTRGSEGVGFSIPSNLVRFAVDALLKSGRVARGYLGVRLPAEVDTGVTEQLGIDAVGGALLAGVLRQSPAEAARLHPVDFITSVDGHKVGSVANLRLVVAQIPVGKQVEVRFIRGGEEQSAQVKITEAPHDGESPSSPDPAPMTAPKNPDLAGLSTATAAPDDEVLAGLQVTDLNRKARLQLGVDDMVTSGVVVTGVRPGSIAESRGLLRGDVIEIACARKGEIQPLANIAAFNAFTKQLKSDQSVVLLVHHGQLSGPEDKSSMFAYLAPATKQ